MFWGIFQGSAPIHADWDSRDTPWHWSLLRTYHRHCESVLEDPTLRDPENHPPPKSIWFDKKELNLWRKDMERLRRESNERGRD